MANLNGGFVGIDHEPETATQAEQITTFNSSGTLTTQPRTTELEYLVVAGGGAGNHGGGGGGGFRTGTGNPVSGNSPYPVTVGAGGAAVTSSPVFTRSAGASGADSVLGTPVPITSEGGGGGGAPGQYSGGPVYGRDGGSGGGSGASNGPIPSQPATNEGQGNSPPVSPPQGNPGGHGRYSGYSYGWAGGGGGAGGAGIEGASATILYGTPEPTGYYVWGGSVGGAGAPSTISGSDVKYAGGGGGGDQIAADPPGYPSPPQVAPSGSGQDGGGDAARSIPRPGNNTGEAGTANRGGGGGGGNGGTRLDVSGGQGGNGGSGVVIVKEAAVNYTDKTSGVWSLEAVYQNVKNNTWVSS